MAAPSAASVTTMLATSIPVASHTWPTDREYGATPSTEAAPAASTPTVHGRSNPLVQPSQVKYAVSPIVDPSIIAHTVRRNGRPT